MTFSDDFNRADGGLGANWTQISASAMEIVSNHATAAAGAAQTSAAVYASDLPTIDQYVQASFVLPGSAVDREQYDLVGVIARHQDDTHYYSGEVAYSHAAGGSWTYSIIRDIALTLVSTSTSSSPSPGVVKLEVSGTTNVLLSLYVNGVLVLTTTDSSAGRLTTGLKAGVYHSRNDSETVPPFNPTTVGVNATYADNWTAGELGVVSGSAAATLGALISTASGTATPPSITGTIAATLGALTSTATGTAFTSITGTAAVTLGRVTSAGVGTVAVFGTIAVTLGALIADGVGAGGASTGRMSLDIAAPTIALSIAAPTLTISISSPTISIDYSLN